jgi:hypothetical protein
VKQLNTLWVNFFDIDSYIGRETSLNNFQAEAAIILLCIIISQYVEISQLINNQVSKPYLPGISGFINSKQMGIQEVCNIHFADGIHPIGAAINSITELLNQRFYSSRAPALVSFNYSVELDRKTNLLYFTPIIWCYA